MPVAAVARQTRSLNRKNRTNTAVADCGQQPLEAWTGYAAARPSEILVDNFNSGPAKLPGAIGKPILPPLAFKIVHKLMNGKRQKTHCSVALEPAGEGEVGSPPECLVSQSPNFGRGGT